MLSVHNQNYALYLSSQIFPLLGPKIVNFWSSYFLRKIYLSLSAFHSILKRISSQTHQRSRIFHFSVIFLLRLKYRMTNKPLNRHTIINTKIQLSLNFQNESVPLVSATNSLNVDARSPLHTEQIFVFTFFCFYRQFGSN